MTTYTDINKEELQKYFDRNNVDWSSGPKFPWAIIIVFAALAIWIMYILIYGNNFAG